MPDGKVPAVTCFHGRDHAGFDSDYAYDLDADDFYQKIPAYVRVLTETASCVFGSLLWDLTQSGAVSSPPSSAV